MCYTILNDEVYVNCNLFDFSALTPTRGHKYKLHKQQSSVNAYKYFLETEFVTFGIVYLILCWRRRFLITLKDCLIKLICLSLWYCDDCVCVICFFFFMLGIYKG